MNVVVTGEDRASSVLKGIQTGIGAIGLAAGAALGSAIATTTEFADTVDDLNDRLGIGAEATSAWVAAFELGETGIEAGTKALTAFSKEVGSGGKDLEKLGISLKNASGQTKPFNDLMMETADVFADMPDGLEKSALAMQLFGKSGQEMIPFLNRGAEGITELLGEADKLGLTMSGDLLAANDEMSIGLKRLELGFKGVQTMIGSAVIPVLASLVTSLNGALTSVIAFIKPFMPAVAPILAVVAAIGSLVGGGAALTAVLAPVAGILGGLLSAIAPLIAPIIALTAAVAALGLAWQMNLFGIQQVTQSVFGAVMDYLDRVRLGWLNIIDALDRSALAFDPVRQALTVIGNLLKGDLPNAMIGLQNTFEAITTALSTLQPWLDMVARQFEIMGGIVMAVVNGDLTTALNGVKALLLNTVSSWAAMVKAIAAEIAKWAPVVIAELVNLAVQIGQWVVANAPILGKQIEAWTAVFVDWVDDAVKDLAPKIAELIDGLTRWIEAQKPGLETKLDGWAREFVDWVLKVGLPLLLQLNALLAETLRWIGDRAPDIAIQLLVWSAEFVKWVAPTIPPLLGALAGLLLEITGWIIGAAAEAIRDAAKALTQAIIDGIMDLASSLLTSVQNLIRDNVIQPVIDAKTTAYNKGKELIGEIVRGVLDVPSFAWSLAQKLIAEILSAIGQAKTAVGVGNAAGLAPGALSFAAATGAYPALAPTATAPTINVTVNGVVSTSVQQLASQLTPAIRTQLARGQERGDIDFNLSGR